MSTENKPLTPEQYANLNYVFICGGYYITELCFISCMEQYAAQQTAEKDMRIQELEEVIKRDRQSLIEKDARIKELEKEPSAITGQSVSFTSDYNEWRANFIKEGNALAAPISSAEKEASADMLKELGESNDSEWDIYEWWQNEARKYGAKPGDIIYKWIPERIKELEDVKKEMAEVLADRNKWENLCEEAVKNGSDAGFWGRFASRRKGECDLLRKKLGTAVDIIKECIKSDAYTPQLEDRMRTVLASLESTEQDEGPWVSVKDQIPPDGNYLAVYRFGVVESKRVFGRFIISRGDFIELPDVTHWMPLPEPPKI